MARWPAGDHDTGDPTNLTIMIYTTPRTSSNNSHDRRPPGGGTSPAMVARWPRLAALRRYEPVVTKWRGPGARVAHCEHKGATGRRWEAMKVAGHGEAARWLRLPEKRKEMAVREMRAELAGVSGQGGAQEWGEFDDTVALARDGSMVAALCGGARRRQWQKQRKKEEKWRRACPFKGISDRASVLEGARGRGGDRELAGTA
jgi:hypothetical protein